MSVLLGQLKFDPTGTETRLRAEIANLRARMTMRLIVIVGSLHAVLFVFLKLS